MFYPKWFICYKLISTLGFHPEALPTSELHPDPPQHTQEELGDPHHICFVPRTTGTNRYHCLFYFVHTKYVSYCSVKFCPAIIFVVILCTRIIVSR